MRAFKHSSILGYDLPWDSIIPSKVNVFAPLSEEEMELKLKALSCYKSQSTKSYFQPGVMRSIATMRGIQCGQPLAEAYEAIRWIISL